MLKPQVQNINPVKASPEFVAGLGLLLTPNTTIRLKNLSKVESLRLFKFSEISSFTIEAGRNINKTPGSNASKVIKLKSDIALILN